MIVRFLRLACLLLIPTALSETALATLIQVMDWEDLVERSPMIVVAEVQSRDAHWDDRSRIVTDVTLQVTQHLRGATAAGGMIQVRCLGGSVGDVAMHVEGEPSFEASEYLLFAYRDSENHWRTTGMSQGVMEIDRRSGEPFVIPGGGGLALTQRVGGRLAPAQAALTKPTPMREVLTRVRSSISREGD
ncbi:MAG: hypothetical protein AAF550_09650 [Myxococcota bacterium]